MPVTHAQKVDHIFWWALCGTSWHCLLLHLCAPRRRSLTTIVDVHALTSLQDNVGWSSRWFYFFLYTIIHDLQVHNAAMWTAVQVAYTPLGSPSWIISVMLCIHLYSFLDYELHRCPYFLASYHSGKIYFCLPHFHLQLRTSLYFTFRSLQQCYHNKRSFSFLTSSRAALSWHKRTPGGVLLCHMFLVEHMVGFILGRVQQAYRVTRSLYMKPTLLASYYVACTSGVHIEGNCICIYTCG